MTKIVHIEIDITGAIDLEGPLSTSTVIAMPDEPRGAPIIFLFPGGTLSKEYFHYSLAGRGGYSMIEHLAQRGYIAVACDHLGAGKSSHPEPSQLTLENLAAGNHATVKGLLARLRKGDLADVGSVTPAFVLGAGQSMGGCLTIVQQANHRTFDAIAIMGYSAIHTHIPGSGSYLKNRPADQTTGGLAHAEQPMDYPPGIPPGYLWAGRPHDLEAFRPYAKRAFHWGCIWEDVPVEDAFDALAQWRSTCPPIAQVMLQPGAVKHYASKIEAPVLVANGERDVCENPHAEPMGYPSCTDISVLVVPRMAHEHNIASTRHVLWDRVADWGKMVTAGKALGKEGSR